MRFRRRRTWSLRLASLALIGFAVLASGCMGYAPDGSVMTPAPPGQEAGSRLPSLLSQLQGAGAGIELLDGSQSQVLAAQDAQGKEASTATATVAGASTPGATATPVQGTPTRAGTATRTPTPTRTPTGGEGSNATPTPGATETATPTATATSTTTPTPSPTPTSTPTPTPIAGPPSEGEGPVGTPPTE